MKICIDARILRDVITGLGHYTLNFIRHLAKADQDNEYILLLRPLHHRSIVAQHNFREVTLPYGNCSPRNVLFGSHVINNIDIDVYHSLFHFLPFGLNVPRTILTLHDPIWGEEWSLVHPNRNRKWLKKGIATPLIRDAVNKADHVITNSENARRDALRAYGGVSEKYSAVHLGVDPVFFGSRSGKQIDLIPEGKSFVFAMSHRQSPQSIENFLRAFAIIAPAYPDLHLLILGSGGGSRGPAHISYQLAIEDRVVFVDQLDYAQVHACFTRAQFFVLPSKIEGFEQPVLEAMASGCPVIASPPLTASEVVEPRVILADPQDTASFVLAMRNLLDNSSLRQRISCSGRAQASQFSWDTCTRKILDIYHSTTTNMAAMAE